MNLAEKYLQKGHLLSPELYEALKKGLDEEEISFSGLVLKEPRESEIKVLKNFRDKPKKLGVEDVVGLYNRRFEILKKIIEKRMGNLVSVNKAPSQGEVNLIGMVMKEEGSDVHSVYVNPFYLEDTTGKIGLDFSNLKNIHFSRDEIIGVKGKISKKVVYPDKIYYPDIKFRSNYTDEDNKALFLSDLNLENGGPLKRVEKVIKEKDISYVFIAGDVSKRSYKTFTKFLDRIDREVVVIPGEKDSADSIPQEPMNLNCISLSNPCMVSLKNIKIFLYHGQNLPDSIKDILKLVRKRHLSPDKLHPYDPLLLEEEPDIIHIGHKYRGHLNYKGVTLLSSGPNKGYIVNMKNRDVEEITW